MVLGIFVHLGMPSNADDHDGAILSELGFSLALRLPFLLIHIYILFSFLSVLVSCILLFLPVGRDAPGSPTAASVV